MIACSSKAKKINADQENLTKDTLEQIDSLIVHQTKSIKPDWEVIINDAEGQVMSIEIVRPDTSLLLPTDEYNYGYEDKYHEGTFINDTTYLIHRFGSSPRNAAVSCKIYRSGDFTLHYHAHEKDTIRMIKYEYEMFQLPYYQFYHVFTESKKGQLNIDTRYFNYLFKSEEKIPRHKRGVPKKNAVHFFDYNNLDDIEFVLSGIEVCSKPSILRRQLEVKSGDSIKINEDVITRIDDNFFINGKNIINLWDDEHPSNTYQIRTDIHWLGDFDCDGVSEFILHYEAHMTNYYRLFKKDTTGSYQNITSSSFYWD